MENKKKYLTNTVKQYDKLFKLPRRSIIISSLFLMSVFTSCLSFLLIQKSFQGIINGVFFGIVAIFLPTIFSDFLLNKYIKDVINYHYKDSSGLVKN